MRAENLTSSSNSIVGPKKTTHAPPEVPIHRLLQPRAFLCRPRECLTNTAPSGSSDRPWTLIFPSVPMQRYMSRGHISPGRQPRKETKPLGCIEPTPGPIGEDWRLKLVATPAASVVPTVATDQWRAGQWGCPAALHVSPELLPSWPGWKSSQKTVLHCCCTGNDDGSI